MILENVRGLINHNKGETFSTLCAHLKNHSYYVKHQVLNTKLITTIPHNRERVFIIAFKHYNDYINFNFDFKNKKPLHIKHFLESNVSEKYYFKKDSRVYNALKESNINFKSINNSIVYRYNFGKVIENKSNVSPCLLTSSGSVPIILDHIGFRKFTPKECLNLQGFNNYSIDGFSDSFIYKCTGNTITVDVLDLIFAKIIKLF